MKTYLHISVDAHQDIEEFIPRVPLHRAGGEDETRKRVCVSTSIEGCVKAAPSIWYRAYEYPSMDSHDPYQHMSWVTTLLDHGERAGYLLKVYEFNLAEDSLVSAATLKENNWVPDADLTDEHWIMQPVTPSRSYYILLEDVKEDGQPVFNYTKFERNELGRTESYFDTFERQCMQTNGNG